MGRRWVEEVSRVIFKFRMVRGEIERFLKGSMYRIKGVRGK